jgi:exopolysaccharide biosynthesis polyprenyl glycosylphosphotransferase
VARRLASFEDIELLGYVDDDGVGIDRTPLPTNLTRLGTIKDLPRICAERDADRVVVAFSQASAPELAEPLRQLPSEVQISIVPRLFDLLCWRSHIDELHGLPVMDVAPPVLGRVDRTLKRATDVAVSLSTLVLLAPVWIVIAILIKATSSGPVFFRQVRSGRDGKPFRIYKFRTMRVGADDEKATLEVLNEVDGPLFKLKDDPRVTSVGRVLRATSLDELPQLLNVLTGDMSLVGPRPFVVDEAGKIDGWAARRFDVRPGMTGLWQVCGRNDLPFEELRRLDYAYVASWSLGWDLKIMWQTPGSVLRRHGAY